MPILSDYWSRLQKALFNPGVDDAALELSLREARANLPIPVIWLLGKTQSGKTSIIRTLTDNPDTEIGNGFQPCTRTARIYAFPPELPVVRFLDTRGLGERDYDPGEDIQFCETQAHLVFAVMKAADSDQRDVVEVLRKVRKRHPDWPVLVVQTALHERYPPGATHIRPYPYGVEPLPETVPADLARALQAQRSLFEKFPGKAPIHFVAVDFTLPEDGWSPVDYGLETLWDEIEALWHFGLKKQLFAEKGVRDLFARKAHQHIIGYSTSAAAAGMLPVVDLAGVTAVQGKMLHALAALYGQNWNRRMLGEFAGLLGSGIAFGFGGKMLAKSIIKLIPGWGQTVGIIWGAVVSGSTTYALGKAAAYFFAARHHGENIDPVKMRAIYAESLASGTQILKQRFSAGQGS